MAFCSSCGAEVKGAFCQQCGVAAVGAQAATPVAAPRRTSPLVWILGILGGLLVLCLLVAAAVMYWFVSNPGQAMAKLITAANPNAEILNVDDAGKRITIRDRRGGQEVTLSFDDVRNGRFSMTAIDENGKTGRVEIGSGSGKLPSWVPVYPGARMESHISGTGDDGVRAGEGGVYTFSTGEGPSRVMSFYQDQCRELGMKVELSTATADGGRIAAEDESGDRSLIVVVNSASGGSSGSVTFKRKQ